MVPVPGTRDRHSEELNWPTTHFYASGAAVREILPRPELGTHRRDPDPRKATQRGSPPLHNPPNSQLASLYLGWSLLLERHMDHANDNQHNFIAN